LSTASEFTSLEMAQLRGMEYLTKCAASLFEKGKKQKEKRQVKGKGERWSRGGEGS